MHNKNNLTTQTIQLRRSIFPPSYQAKSIDKEVIMQILDAANCAPTHRLTQPWRFRIFHSEEARQNLSDFLIADYRQTVALEQQSEIKLKKMAKNPLLAGCVLGIVLHRDPKASVPEWEEVAAVACAVQNMWLTCTDLGLGAYWSTPEARLRSTKLLNLNELETCLGFFYMGYHNLNLFDLSSPRSPITEKISWL